MGIEAHAEESEVIKIIGAGLSGLIAGAMIPGSTIYEKQPTLPNNHGALLRFRSNKIGEALGIPFKKVRVTKAIWLYGAEVQPTPRVQNMYSGKVVGNYLPRSIGDIAPVDRYIAPYNFIDLLAKRCDINYGYDAFVEQRSGWGPIISTIPMPITMAKMGLAVPGGNLTFLHQPIWSKEYLCNHIDLYQTIYFPGSGPIYRASFTGEKLLLEFNADPKIHGIDLYDVQQAFGIEDLMELANPMPEKEQHYGKLVPIEDYKRKTIMRNLTQDQNIYSLGRYATWRNILLDDVFDDVFKIRSLIEMDDYARKLAIGEL
jgi:hypothetical protein